MNHEEFNDSILVGMIKVLEIMKEVKSEGDDLNTIDFDEIIEMRKRDIVDTSMLDSIICTQNKNTSFVESSQQHWKEGI